MKVRIRSKSTVSDERRHGVTHAGYCLKNRNRYSASKRRNQAGASSSSKSSSGLTIEGKRKTGVVGISEASASHSRSGPQR